MYSELLNKKNNMDGLQLLHLLDTKSVDCAFLDPQYRGLLDSLNYGDEGIGRAQRRCELQQMDTATINGFVKEIYRVLKPSSYLFLWCDKFSVLNDYRDWIANTTFKTVDFIVWDKVRLGMGHRTRNCAEFIVVLQKPPKKARSTWLNRKMPNILREKITETQKQMHTHSKPIRLQSELIKSVTKNGGLVLDPCAGSYSVLEACQRVKRNFIGCDIKG